MRAATKFNGRFIYIYTIIHILIYIHIYIYKGIPPACGMLPCFWFAAACF